MTYLEYVRDFLTIVLNYRRCHMDANLGFDSEGRLYNYGVAPENTPIAIVTWIDTDYEVEFAMRQLWMEHIGWPGRDGMWPPTQYKWDNRYWVSNFPDGICTCDDHLPDSLDLTLIETNSEMRFVKV